MTYTPDTELYRLRRWRAERILELARAGEPDRIHGSLLLAIGSRETGLTNVVGGGYFADPNNPQSWVQTGVDRGLYQINAVYHAAWLKSVPGCLSGEYAEAFPPSEGGAYPEGRVPGLTAATKKAVSILRYNCTFAEKQGVDDPDVLWVAVAGWNGGVGTCVNAYKKYGDADRFTTGRDYGRDVLARQKEIRRFLQRKGWG